MNDPHVVALIYDIDHGISVSYDEAKPLVVERPEFRLEVKDNKARFYMKNHYETEADAREAIEEYIRKWEFEACLQGGPDYFSLRFQRAMIEDRDPPPPTPGFVVLRSEPIIASGSVSVAQLVVASGYPPPPSDVALTPDVQTLYDRYMGHRRGHEPLTGTAYFCLSYLEFLAIKEIKRQNTRKTKIKGRDAAAEYFQISRKVLDRIGALSTGRGGRLEARKPEGVNRDLTSEERRYLEEAVKEMIRRVAQRAHSPKVQLRQITLSDLPQCKV